MLPEGNGMSKQADDKMLNPTSDFLSAELKQLCLVKVK